MRLHYLIYMIENDLLTHQQKINAVLDVLNTVKMFHEYKLQCTDIKLENMMYCDGHVKMCDFDQHAFTIIYSPPERFNDNAQYIGKYSDVWAIGIYIYILWTMELPYQSITDPIKPDWETIHQELELGYQFDMTNLPTKIAEICGKCLTYEYYKRPTIDWLIEQFNDLE